MSQDRLLLFASIIIGTTFLLTQVNFSLYLPSMPTLAHLYSVSSSKMMTSMSYGFFGYMVGQLFWGTASDYAGRKRMLLIALLLYVVCVALLIFSTSINYFFALFTLMGFAIAACTSIGNAFMLDIYGPTKVKIAISYLGITMASGPFIFPLIGALLLTRFNWQAPFIFLLIACILIIIGIMTTVKEPKKVTPISNQKKSDQNIIKRFTEVLTNRQFLAYIFALATCFGMYFSYLTVSSYLFTHRLRLSITDYTFFNILVIGAFFAGAIIFSQLVKKVSLKQIALTALIITVLGAASLTTITLTHDITLITVTAALMLFLLGLGLIVPTSKAGCISCKSKNSGVTSSCMKLIQSLGAVLLSGLAAHLNVSTTLLPLSILYISGSVVALIGFFILHPTS